MKTPNVKALRANQQKHARKLQAEAERKRRLLKEGIRTHRTVRTRGDSTEPVSTRLCLSHTNEDINAPNWITSEARALKKKDEARRRSRRKR